VPTDAPVRWRLGARVAALPERPVHGKRVESLWGIEPALLQTQPELSEDERCVGSSCDGCRSLGSLNRKALRANAQRFRNFASGAAEVGRLGSAPVVRRNATRGNECGSRSHRSGWSTTHGCTYERGVADTLSANI
jgi:hypothetical protein